MVGKQGVGSHGFYSERNSSAIEGRKREEGTFSGMERRMRERKGFGGSSRKKMGLGEHLEGEKEGFIKQALRRKENREREDCDGNRKESAAKSEKREVK